MKCYTYKLASGQEQRDLIDLCPGDIIPQECHGFYYAVDDANTVPCRLTEPDIL